MIRLLAILSFVGSLLVLTGSGVSTRLPGRTLLEGEFKVSYFGSRGGEDFEIAQTDDGFAMRARLRPSDDTPPSTTTYTLDNDRNFVSAVFERDDGVRVDYRIENGRLVGDATRDGRSIGRESAALCDERVVSGPNYSTDFFVLHPRDLEVGEEDNYQAAIFGFPDWRPTPLDLTVKREKDKTIRLEDGRRINARVYRSVLATPDRTIKARSYLDSNGYVLRLTVDMPIGRAVADLHLE